MGGGIQVLYDKRKWAAVYTNLCADCSGSVCRNRIAEQICIILLQPDREETILYEKNMGKRFVRRFDGMFCRNVCIVHCLYWTK